jgi:S-adenosylmethionine-diacylglycerol 3-amino-3-carboxypropyl transferase
MTQTHALLSDSVHQSPTLSRLGLLERLFTTWFKGMVYNQIWEDPRVDVEALRLSSDSRILTIASGGCNVLNYLTAQPKAITALDLNICHLSLTRLKLLAARRLPDHETFFQFFGVARGPANRAAYLAHLRPHLDDQQLAHWEGSWPASRIDAFSRGLYNRGSLGMFLRFIHALSATQGIDATRILRASTLQEQRAIFDRDLAPFFASGALRSFTRLPFFLHALGVPPRQYETFVRETHGDVLGAYRDRVRKLLCDFPISENYFAWQALSRTYDIDRRRAVPDYLRPEHFDRLRDGVHRVHTHHDKLTPHLKRQPRGTYDRFIFLDAQDWMTPEQIAELWAEVARVGPEGSRIIFRTGGAESPIESSLPPDLMSRFTREHELSARLHAQDRSSIYGGFHVYSMN